MGRRGPVLAAMAVALAAGRPAVAQSAQRLAAVDRYLREEVRRQRIPGLSVAILRGDRVLLARGYGYANVELRVPATDSTVYQSGSLGKQFTAALVLQFADPLRERIFEPLGMRSARVISEAGIVPNRAAGYRLVGDTLRNQEWVSPSLNTTADGSLYLTVNDLARWAVGLDAHRVLSRSDLAAAWTAVRLNDGGTYPYGFGWSLSELRAQPLVGHTGAWQGFRTSIQRFPAASLTVIVLTNLAQAPPAPIETLIAALANATDTGRVTPGLLHFLSDADRTGWRNTLSETSAWTPLGCDAADGRGITRLGATVAHVCYARAHAADGDVVVTVPYTADWRAADVDSYRF